MCTRDNVPLRWLVDIVLLDDDCWIINIDLINWLTLVIASITELANSEQVVCLLPQMVKIMPKYIMIWYFYINFVYFPKRCIFERFFSHRFASKLQVLFRVKQSFLSQLLTNDPTYVEHPYTRVHTNFKRNFIQHWITLKCCS